MTTIHAVLAELGIETPQGVMETERLRKALRAAADEGYSAVADLRQQIEAGTLTPDAAPAALDAAAQRQVLAREKLLIVRELERPLDSAKRRTLIEGTTDEAFELLAEVYAQARDELVSVAKVTGWDPIIGASPVTRDQQESFFAAVRSVERIEEMRQAFGFEGYHLHAVAWVEHGSDLDRAQDLLTRLGLPSVIKEGIATTVNSRERMQQVGRDADAARQAAAMSTEAMPVDPRDRHARMAALRDRGLAG